MALISPGVEVTVIDESQYIPAATNSVPYILLATAQNKVSGAGVGVAAGTLAANANRIYLIDSQRDLANTFGVPFFYKTTAGTPINGYELNEYGLLAAYSALGITNRAYIQRADIDLAALTASLTRPTGSPDNGTYWLDTANTLWGIFQWNQTTNAFTNQIPLVITDTTDLQPSSTVPLQSIGAIGDYAITATNVNNPGYFKRGGPTTSQTSATELSDYYNTWVALGSNNWKTAWPTIQGTLAPASLTQGQTIIINGSSVAVPGGGNNTVEGLSNAINTAAITGVYSAFIDDKLQIYATASATADGSTGGEGAVEITNGTGTVLADLGITAQTYYAPAFLAAYSYQAPRWRATDDQPEPTGSVWQKLNNVNLGTNLVVKRYNSALGAFVQQACNIYETTPAAIYALDPAGGGQNIPAGTTVGKSNPAYSVPDVFGIELLERYATGPAIYTGSTDSPGPFVIGNTFTISATIPGQATLSANVTATLAGTTAADFVTAVSAAVGSSAFAAYVTASINSAGAIVLTHSAGGDVDIKNVIGSPITTAGFTTTTDFAREAQNGGLYFSYFIGAAHNPTFAYTASDTAPDQDPADGTYWYYSATTQVDVMIQNNGAWKGYRTVSNDVRGDNLTQTNPTGPIFSTTPPTTQTDETDLVFGDLWIDTSDLENYPVIYRWSNVEGADQWVQLANTDQTTQNGILFADARWAPNGTTNPITGAIPTITSLLTSNYLDIDAPDPSLYPQGMLLFNTRRSGFNVKSFQVDYFNTTDFDVSIWDATTQYVFNDFVNYNGIIYVCILAPTANQAPTNTTYWAAIETNAWTTASGNKASGAPYMGRQAQRAIIVAALKAGIDANVEIREEQRQFNLIACPQYPELIPNMVELNNDRKNTAFVIGDTPLRLGPDGNDITAWVTNNGGAGTATEDGLSTGDVYLGVFYPSCQTTDLSGSPVVQPPSHMMIRTIIRSDEVAFPWLAPAGTRRGVIDNAARIGYVNGVTGEFETIGVSQSLRDILYQADINPITFVPGIGITNFGNKTVTTTTTALDRINVARLVAFIRGRLQEIGNTFLFEPNDQITRNEIQNTINSLMIDLVNKRGIYDYLVVCDLTNNTPARIDANELWVDIAIEPVKAVEFIYIPLRIKNTGEIATSISTVATAA